MICEFHLHYAAPYATSIYDGVAS